MGRRTPTIVCILTATAAVVARPGAAGLQGPEAAVVASCADTTGVVERASAYADRLGRELGSLLADEHYQQALHLPGGHVPRFPNEASAAPAPVTMRGTLPLTERTVATRTLRASFLFLRQPDDGIWLGFRDVRQLNGRRVDSGQRAALDVPGEPGLERWRRLSEESARFNLGSTARTINVPTFALAVLQAQHRHRFSFVSVDEPRRRLTRCVVTFEETSRPTIVRGPEGVALPATGSFHIDRLTGRVERSRFAVGSDAAGVVSTSEVTYQHDRRLDLWLPKEMHEEYTTPGVERVTGVATYSKYRRAEVAVRIVPR